jgi:16S rRNA (cytosine1402-N4)-methyltransferase
MGAVDMWADIDDSHVDRDLPGYSHTTVMRAETVSQLGVRAGGVYVDATLGGGGHAEAMLESSPGAMVVGIDRDPSAVVAASQRLARFGERFHVISGAFGDLAELLAKAGIGRVDGIVADLGLSSAQLSDSARGMSFRTEGPLDMRMDPSLGETALDLIDRLSQEELADVIYRFGEERRSRRVARCVKLALQDGRLQTTRDLRRAVVRAVGPARVGGVDPATRTFQALRIAVNGELDQLAALLDQAPAVLTDTGVLAIISFHSLEDRMVKRAFQNRAVWAPITKKPLQASEGEESANPRARSAKLRAAQRVAAPEGGT